jgi:flagellar secretion chaperone FliS
MYAPINLYQNTQVTTATPDRLLLMLHDGAVKFSRIALDRMSRGDISGKGTYIGKALAIVMELRLTLNHETGGEIAANLERLYVYLIERFTTANINNDSRSLENAITILSQLRDTWTEAMEIAKQERCKRVQSAG